MTNVVLFLTLIGLSLTGAYVAIHLAEARREIDEAIAELDRERDDDGR